MRSLLTWWRTRQDRWALAFAFEHSPRLTAYRELLKHTVPAPKPKVVPLNLRVVRSARKVA